MFYGQKFSDHRGVNIFPYYESVFRQALGFSLNIAQVNSTFTLPNTFRGIHYALLPPGQAKYIFPTSGSCIDYLIDLRKGSPTFMTVEKILLNAYSDSSNETIAIYIPEGIGHGICALEKSAQITYLCSQEYNPDNERCITPLDPQLNLGGDPHKWILSARDSSAPLLKDADLPEYSECASWYEKLRSVQ